MKHLSWALLSVFILGAGCTASSDNTAAVNTSDTQQEAGSEKNTEDNVTEVAIEGSGEVAIAVDLDLGEDGAVEVKAVQEANQEESEAEEAAVISMTSSGFSPSKLTVSAGTTVTFVNNDSVERWPASAFHPSHLELPGFDALDGIAPGASYSFTFTEAGTWKFHDHLLPSLTGSVIVE